MSIGQAAVQFIGLRLDAVQGASGLFFQFTDRFIQAVGLVRRRPRRRGLTGRQIGRRRFDQPVVGRQLVGLCDGLTSLRHLARLVTHRGQGFKEERRAIPHCMGAGQQLKGILLLAEIEQIDSGVRNRLTGPLQVSGCKSGPGGKWYVVHQCGAGGEVAPGFLNRNTGPRSGGILLGFRLRLRREALLEFCEELLGTLARGLAR